MSFSVLLFNSLWRGGSLIPPKEFANVIGRVGRAYVDIDGIFVLPVYEKTSNKRRRRIKEFHQLVKKARGRELESGLYLLIRVCLDILRNRLGIHGETLREYVLNQQPAIDNLTTEDDDDAHVLSVVLAELDAGILALVESVDCDVTEVARQLDDALASSYWQRRLSVRELDERTEQLAVIHGRATHIWNQTNPRQRTGFFSASIGTEAGLIIVEHSETLRTLLIQATNAIMDFNTDLLAASCGDLAAILFRIYPFQPRSLPTNWKESEWRLLLSVWISGAPLADLADSQGIAFVQEALVFRLVWAIESVRLVLSAVANEEADDATTSVAICLTYGVPTIAAARLLEAGMESRLLAVRLVSTLGLTFATNNELLEWLIDYLDSEPIDFSQEERVVWQRFLTSNESDHKSWHRSQNTVELNLRDNLEVAPGDSLRIVTDDSGRGIILTADFEQLGDVPSGLPANKSLVGIILNDSEIEIKQFGP